MKLHGGSPHETDKKVDDLTKAFYAIVNGWELWQTYQRTESFVETVTEEFTVTTHLRRISEKHTEYNCKIMQANVSTS